MAENFVFAVIAAIFGILFHGFVFQYVKGKNCHFGFKRIGEAFGIGELESRLERCGNIVGMNIASAGCSRIQKIRRIGAAGKSQGQRGVVPKKFVEGFGDGPDTGKMIHIVFEDHKGFGYLGSCFRVCKNSPFKRHPVISLRAGNFYAFRIIYIKKVAKKTNPIIQISFAYDFVYRTVFPYGTENRWSDGFGTDGFLRDAYDIVHILHGKNTENITFVGITNEPA